jgi:hypothetical protein
MLAHWPRYFLTDPYDVSANSYGEFGTGRKAFEREAMAGCGFRTLYLRQKEGTFMTAENLFNDRILYKLAIRPNYRSSKTLSHVESINI